MRLRRSLFFVAPATPAGPLAASPARVSRPSPTDPAGPAAVCPAPPKLPKACISHHVGRRSAREGRQDEARAAGRAQVCLTLHRARQASAAKSWRSYRVLPPSGGDLCRAHRGRVLVANPVAEWPFGSPWVRKGRTTKNRRPDRAAPAAQSRLDCSLLPRIARNCPELPGGVGGPEQVSAHRPPFWVGLTTSAVSGSSRRPPGCFRCGERNMNPC